MKNVGNKIKGFVKKHKAEFIAVAIGAGAIIFYSKSFDYGYNARVDFEEICDEVTGSNIVETIKKFSDE